MKRRMSWYWALPAIAGLALVMAAGLLSSTAPVAHAQVDTPTATRTPTPTATVNPACQLSVDKTVEDSTVPLNGNATFTIEVTNDGNGDCNDPQITDVIPDNTDCEDATVDSSSDIDDSDIDIDGCDSSGTVVFDVSTDLNDEDTIVLKLVLSFEDDVDEGDDISNEACATSSSDVGGDCDSARVEAGEEATSTPQATATTAPVIVPTVIVPPPVVPTARALPTLIVPSTGTGPDDSSHTLAYGLGALGAVLLLVSGAVAVKRTR